MRVPTISIYSSAIYQLGVHTESLKESNEVMSTQKVINTLSDDPVGLTQVLDLSETISSLEQIQTNVDMGRAWLTGVETALSSANDLILEMETSVLAISNATMNADDRADAVENVDNVIEQLVSLANTELSGNYIFSGNSTDTAPIVYDNTTDPPTITYAGDDTEFSIRTDKNSEVPVGQVASTVFWDDEVAINSTNNTLYFTEDPGHGQDYLKTVCAVIPDGQYDVETLRQTIENELNRASSEAGYGVTYNVSYDKESQRFSIVEDGAYEGYMATEFLWKYESETEVGNSSIGNEIGFSEENIVSAPHQSDQAVTDDISVTPLTIDAGNSKIDFEEVIRVNDETEEMSQSTMSRSISSTLTATVKEKDYYSYDELASEIEKAMEAESLYNGNEIDYSVTWDDTTQKFTIKENGTELSQFNLLWQSGENAPVDEGGTGQSMGEILGFETEDDLKSPMTGEEPVAWGIFETLIDLRGYLEDNDVDGVQRTIDRLQTSYDHTTSVIADVGMKYNRLEIRDTITSELDLNLTERRSNIEDADIVEAAMDLQSIQTAYEAALSATSKIINTSLMDYL